MSLLLFSFNNIVIKNGDDHIYLSHKFCFTSWPPDTSQPSNVFLCINWNQRWFLNNFLQSMMLGTCNQHFEATLPRYVSWLWNSAVRLTGNDNGHRWICIFIMGGQECFHATVRWETSIVEHFNLCFFSDLTSVLCLVFLFRSHIRFMPSCGWSNSSPKHINEIRFS